jgi:hypothetical protein
VSTHRKNRRECAAKEQVCEKSMRNWQFASGPPPELLERRPDDRQADQNMIDLASTMARVLPALFAAFPARSSCRIKFTGFVKPGYVRVSLISREPSWRIAHNKQLFDSTYHRRNERNRSSDSQETGAARHPCFGCGA